MAGRVHSFQEFSGFIKNNKSWQNMLNTATDF